MLESRLNSLTLVCSLLLFLTLSFDAIWKKGQDNMVTSYIQLMVCLVFLFDFFVRLERSKNRVKFVWSNFLLLLVSIPYMFVVRHVDLDISNGAMYILHFMPIIRGLYALGVMLRFLGKSSISTLFITYLGAMLSMIYFASILFYEYERTVNTNITNYWESLWWACMDATTVGSNIIAQTAMGKVLSVALAAMGMMMFPIFTSFVLGLYHKKNGESVAD